MLHQPPSPRFARHDRVVPLPDAIDERRQVERAIALDLQRDVETVDLDVGERPRAAEEARELEIDRQPLDGRELPPRRMLEPHLARLETQQKRIDADAADGCLGAERLGVSGRIPFDQVGRENEPRQGVQQQRSHCGQEDPAGPDRPEA